MMNRLSVVRVRDDNDGEDVVEIPLLLQGWQITALETAAHNRGQTAGAMVRDLLRDFLSRLPCESTEQSPRRL